MNQFPYLYPHSLSEVERLNEEELWQDSQNTISGYLEYISDHDLYRNMHPLYPVQSKKNSPPPMKGTKRYRKEQKRAAKKARRQSIAHVLTLIENLDTQARVARSM